MSRVDNKTSPSQAPDPFIARWSQRKLALKQETPSAKPADAELEAAQEAGPLAPTDEDMPPLESLDRDSDYSGFLSPRVSDELRQLALRKLFLDPLFNVCDGLDDYDEDFTSFAKLGDIITADMRHRLEQEAHRAEQAQAPETSDEVTASPQSAAEAATDDAEAHAEEDLVANEDPDTEERVT